MMNTQAQVAGPSRIPGTLPSKERLLMSTMKAGRILGEGISTSFLRLGEVEQNKDMQSGQVILNSPDNTSPSLSPWDPSKVRSSISNSTRILKMPSQETFPTGQRTTIESCYQHKKLSASTSSTETAVYVAPLNIKPRPRRKSLSLAAIELDISAIMISPDQSYTSTDSTTSPYQSQSMRRKQLPVAPESNCPPSRSGSFTSSCEGLTRSQSLRRHPRPLPPVPNARASICVSPAPGSRPASPSGSFTSVSSSNNMHQSSRPLPVPPAVEGSPCPSTSTPSSSPKPSPRPSPRIICDLPTPPSHLVVTNPSPSPISPTISLSPLEFAEDSEPSTPLSPISGITNLSILSPSPKKKRPSTKRRSRVHASPYKLAVRGLGMGAARYSTTSLSSQVSVPPVPPASELRRRNRDKMAKLMRVLGESPPSELVFSPDDTNAPRLGRVSEEDRNIFIPHFRSASIDTQFSHALVEKSQKKKALSDPEAGHGIRTCTSNANITTISPPNSNTTISQPRTRSPSAFLRLRAKRGRSTGTAARYVVSLGGADHERLTFRVLGEGGLLAKKKPSGSYLRGAYALDAKNCVYENGEARWEIDDYEKIVKSLRKL